MTLDDFRQSLAATDPPAGLTHALAGLWWDAKGDWTRAHESAQQDGGPEGSWVYAYPLLAEEPDISALLGGRHAVHNGIGEPVIGEEFKPDVPSLCFGVKFVWHFSLVLSLSLKVGGGE